MFSTNQSMFNFDCPDWCGDHPKGKNIMKDKPEFYAPGSNSALRAGKRVHPCPTCKKPNRLTAKDIQLHYQCDDCADKAEAGYVGY